MCSASPVQRKRSSSRSAAQHREFVVIRAMCLDPTVYRWNASEAVQPSLAKSACATNQRTRSPAHSDEGPKSAQNRVRLHTYHILNMVFEHLCLARWSSEDVQAARPAGLHSHCDAPYSPGWTRGSYTRPLIRMNQLDKSNGRPFREEMVRKRWLGTGNRRLFHSCDDGGMNHTWSTLSIATHIPITSLSAKGK